MLAVGVVARAALAWTPKLGGTCTAGEAGRCGGRLPHHQAITTPRSTRHSPASSQVSRLTLLSRLSGVGRRLGLAISLPRGLAAALSLAAALAVDLAGGRGRLPP